MAADARRGFAAAAPDRRSADGRHERGRRPVRRGQDVSAAGGQERARDEAGGGAPDARNRGRKTPGPGAWRRRAACPGQDRDRHRQGRCARHRQKHRHRGAAMQQLRGGEHGRDGALPPDPGQGQRGGGRDRGLVGPDHAQPRRNAVRGGRNAKRRLFRTARRGADDRRGHHQPGPHGGENCPALQRPGGLCARRLAQRGRGAEPAGPRAQRVRGRARQRLRARAPAARQQKENPAGVAGASACQQGRARLGCLHPGAAQVHWPARVQKPRSGRAGALYRLGPVLPDLGFGRPLPRHPRR